MANMLKVGLRGTGRAWNHKGKTEIAEIIISCSATCINYIHFLYVEDGGKKLVMSEKIGQQYYGNTKFLNTIMLDYPREVITGVTGKYQTACGGEKRLISLTVVTNKCKYGPLETGEKDRTSKESEFVYNMGCKQFGSFFGTSASDGIETIGIYLKPIEMLPDNNSIKTE